MQSELSGRYINSVSDILYSPDEIEFLLEDIRDLEPISYKPDEIQDFEIAGSRTGALSAECGTHDGCDADGEDEEEHEEEEEEECESPLGTVNSWDSHSHYRRMAGSPDLSLYSGVILYCDYGHLKTPTGFIRVLLLATTIACLTCLCTSGTVKVGLFMLPMVGRIRMMMFVTLLSIFITCLLLFLDISHTVYLFPFNWGKLNTYIYVGLGVLFLIASSLLFHMVFLTEALSWVPKWSQHQLIVTGSLGYVCCLQSLLICLVQQRKPKVTSYEPVGEDPSLNLQERHPSPLLEGITTSQHKSSSNMVMIANQAHNINFRAIRKTIVEIDDVQPCSSKSVEPVGINTA
ncbi:uncharacterized protein LOC126739561 [Anthonomus grandis grandis]|uniref:uncharacterized protein LOC126739561 n=1 Tax=Anthonomus grandis grandis TaxID=2921223 RepID=UPI00216664BF|nr:uncharacterized protein LOC126739561 [Anthonomus grandis grandis]